MWRFLAGLALAPLVASVWVGPGFLRPTFQEPGAPECSHAGAHSSPELVGTSIADEDGLMWADVEPVAGELVDPPVWLR